MPNAMRRRGRSAVSQTSDVVVAAVAIGVGNTYATATTAFVTIDETSLRMRVVQTGPAPITHISAVATGVAIVLGIGAAVLLGRVSSSISICC